MTHVVEVVAGENPGEGGDVGRVGSERQERPARQLQAGGRVRQAKPVQDCGQDVCAAGQCRCPLSVTWDIKQGQRQYIAASQTAVAYPHGAYIVSN